MHELADDHSGLVDCACGEDAKKYWVKLPENVSEPTPVVGTWDDVPETEN